MASIIVPLYLLSILFYILVSLFIIYHLTKFALVSQFKIIMVSLFTIVSIGLLLFNVSIFFSIDWENVSYQLTF